MNDPEGDAYYSKKQKKADETAALFMKITFYMLLFGLGYAAGSWVGNNFA